LINSAYVRGLIGFYRIPSDFIGIFELCFLKIIFDKFRVITRISGCSIGIYQNNFQNDKIPKSQNSGERFRVITRIDRILSDSIGFYRIFWNCFYLNCFSQIPRNYADLWISRGIYQNTFQNIKITKFQNSGERLRVITRNLSK